jgi:hypothetical protein
MIVIITIITISIIIFYYYTTCHCNASPRNMGAVQSLGPSSGDVAIEAP